MPTIRPPVPGVDIRLARTGLGIFASRSFRKGHAIGRIPGRVHNWRVLLRRGGAFLANCFRFGYETYLDPGNGLGRYLNHSCAPNAGIRKRDNKLYLFAARDLKTGEEIVIDYSTTIGDDDIYRMRCHCGARSCRRWVSRFGLLPRRLRYDYFRRGLVPELLFDALEEPPATLRSRRG